MTQGPPVGPRLFVDLAEAGFLARAEPDPEHGGRGSWRLLGGEGVFEHDGRCYLPLEVSRLPPFYQETYRDIVVRRLGRAGFGDGTGVVFHDGLILAWAPAAVMRESSPALVAVSRLSDGDEAWVDELDQDFRDAARSMERQADEVWADLVDGRASRGALQALLDAKAALNALAIDSLVPPNSLLESWVAPYVAPDLVADVVDGCLLPASGFVAFDVYEEECWRLAESFLRVGHLPAPARRRFVQQALFFQFESLDTTRKRYLFQDQPIQLAVRFAAVASGPGEAAARRDEIRERPWRRRFHRAWAYDLLRSAQGDAAAGRRLPVVHRFLGIAREFDEEKRRLNSKLWRSLLAVADAVDVALQTASRADLLSAVERRGGRLEIDPDLIAAADPDGTESGALPGGRPGL